MIQRIACPLVSALALVSLGTLVGCKGGDVVSGFRDPNYGGLARASFDLECPAGQIQVVDLGANTVGVTGCGKRSVYKFVYGGVGWVKNSETEAKVEAKADAPPAQ